jgi:(p)ppGpp synthase/HD superfamily hydrolase
VSNITSRSAKRALGRILRRREETEALASGKTRVEEYIREVAARTTERPETIERTLRRRLGLQKIEDVYRGVGRGKYVLSSLEH